MVWLNINQYLIVAIVILINTIILQYKILLKPWSSKAILYCTMLISEYIRVDPAAELMHALQCTSRGKSSHLVIEVLG